MENLSAFCAPGASVEERMIDIADGVSLRLITFTPAEDKGTPPVLFVAGWISLIVGWKDVLREMTKDFTVYYIETREKISSRIKKRTNQSVQAIGGDIVALTEQLKLESSGYILLGSSLGGTAILDCCRHLTLNPGCLVLIEPNAEFRVPKTWKLIVNTFYPGLFIVLKPVVKWYLRTFRLNVEADPAQYAKYCNALDAADPWKLKRAVKSLWGYEVWNLLEEIDIPTLILNASEDKLHEPENLRKIADIMPDAELLDMETNKQTHSASMVDELRKYLSRIP